MIIPRGQGLRGIFCFRGSILYSAVYKINTCLTLCSRGSIQNQRNQRNHINLWSKFVKVATLFSGTPSCGRIFKPRRILYATTPPGLQKK